MSLASRIGGRGARGTAPSLLLAALLVGVLAALAACSETPEPASQRALTAEELLDPESCKDCHTKHYLEWSGSMHAYAAEDPVFIAMNQRGQRETNGALGDFCIKCHAPMAVLLGATKDGLNMAEVPKKLHGVTCIYCHTVAEVQGEHNAALRLADDGVLRGGIADPVVNPAHKMGYSELLDGAKRGSADVCGTCHDIVTPAGVHLERTFKEWKGTLFASDAPGQFLSCASCHMHTSQGPAADADGVKVRTLHDHSFPGVDVALTDFPMKAAQRQHVQDDLDTALVAQLCVEITDTAAHRVEVMLQNVAAGHHFPSGATQDRRVWVELIASKAGATIYQSGVVADGQAVAKLDDPDLWLLRDWMYDEQFNEVHMFWEAVKTVSEALIGPPKGAAPGTPEAETRQVRSYRLSAAPDEVRMRVRVRPMGIDVLQNLVDSGDLDKVHIAAMPTFDLAGTVLTWRAAEAKETISPTGRPALCVPKLLIKGADDLLAGAEPYAPGLEKAGKQGQLTFVLRDAKPAPPGVGNNTWEVEIRDAAGAPVLGLDVSAGTWMPEHNHGSPITASSVELGAGRYRLAPVELFMPGLWEITVAASGKDAAAAPVDDQTVFRFWAAE